MAGDTRLRRHGAVEDEDPGLHGRGDALASGTEDLPMGSEGDSPQLGSPDAAPVHASPSDVAPADCQMASPDINPLPATSPGDVPLLGSPDAVSLGVLAELVQQLQRMLALQEVAMSDDEVAQALRIGLFHESDGVRAAAEALARKWCLQEGGIEGIVRGAGDAEGLLRALVGCGAMEPSAWLHRQVTAGTSVLHYGLKAVSLKTHSAALLLDPLTALLWHLMWVLAKEREALGPSGGGQVPRYFLPASARYFAAAVRAAVSGNSTAGRDAAEQLLRLGVKCMDWRAEDSKGVLQDFVTFMLRLDPRPSVLPAVPYNTATATPALCADDPAASHTLIRCVCDLALRVEGGEPGYTRRMLSIMVHMVADWRLGEATGSQAQRGDEYAKRWCALLALLEVLLRHGAGVEQLGRCDLGAAVSAQADAQQSLVEACGRLAPLVLHAEEGGEKDVRPMALRVLGQFCALPGADRVFVADATARLAAALPAPGVQLSADSATALSVLCRLALHFGGRQEVAAASAAAAAAGASKGVEELALRLGSISLQRAAGSVVPLPPGRAGAASLPPGGGAGTGIAEAAGQAPVGPAGGTSGAAAGAVLQVVATSIFGLFERAAHSLPRLPAALGAEAAGLLMALKEEQQVQLNVHIAAGSGLLSQYASLAAAAQNPSSAVQASELECRLLPALLVAWRHPATPTKGPVWQALDGCLQAFCAASAAHKGRLASAFLHACRWALQVGINMTPVLPLLEAMGDLMVTPCGALGLHDEDGMGSLAELLAAELLNALSMGLQTGVVKRYAGGLAKALGTLPLDASHVTQLQVTYHLVDQCSLACRASNTRVKNILDRLRGAWAAIIQGHAPHGMPHLELDAHSQLVFQRRARLPYALEDRFGDEVEGSGSSGCNSADDAPSQRASQRDQTRLGRVMARADDATFKAGVPTVRASLRCSEDVALTNALTLLERVMGHTAGVTTKANAPTCHTSLDLWEEDEKGALDRQERETLELARTLLNKDMDLQDARGAAPDGSYDDPGRGSFFETCGGGRDDDCDEEMELGLSHITVPRGEALAGGPHSPNANASWPEGGAAEDVALDENVPDLAVADLPGLVEQDSSPPVDIKPRQHYLKQLAAHAPKELPEVMSSCAYVEPSLKPMPEKEEPAQWIARRLFDLLLSLNSPEREMLMAEVLPVHQPPGQPRMWTQPRTQAESAHYYAGVTGKGRLVDAIKVLLYLWEDLKLAVMDVGSAPQFEGPSGCLLAWNPEDVPRVSSGLEDCPHDAVRRFDILWKVHECALAFKADKKRRETLRTACDTVMAKLGNSTDKVEMKNVLEAFITELQVASSPEYVDDIDAYLQALPAAAPGGHHAVDPRILSRLVSEVMMPPRHLLGNIAWGLLKDQHPYPGCFKEWLRSAVAEVRSQPMCGAMTQTEVIQLLQNAWATKFALDPNVRRWARQLMLVPSSGAYISTTACGQHLPPADLLVTSKPVAEVHGTTWYARLQVAKGRGQIQSRVSFPADVVRRLL